MSDRTLKEDDPEDLRIMSLTCMKFLHKNISLLLSLRNGATIYSKYTLLMTTPSEIYSYVIPACSSSNICLDKNGYQVGSFLISR